MWAVKWLKAGSAHRSGFWSGYLARPFQVGSRAVWALGEGPVFTVLRAVGNRVRLVSQSSVTYLSCRWKDSGPRSPRPSKPVG